jgi:hypothetical protein
MNVIKRVRGREKEKEGGREAKKKVREECLDGLTKRQFDRIY